jgi:hypothetical protein
MYLSGDNIKTASGNDQMEWERTSAWFTSFSPERSKVGFGWRNGKSNSEAARNQDQNRVFVSYSIPRL